MTRTKYIHVNQHIIKSNAQTGDTQPVLTVKNLNRSGSTTVGNHIKIIHMGEVVAEVIYSPDVPLLACGARVAIKTTCEVEVSDFGQADEVAT